MRNQSTPPNMIMPWALYVVLSATAVFAVWQVAVAVFCVPLLLDVVVGGVIFLAVLLLLLAAFTWRASKVARHLAIRDAKHAKELAAAREATAKAIIDERLVADKRCANLRMQLAAVGESDATFSSGEHAVFLASHLYSGRN